MELIVRGSELWKDVTDYEGLYQISSHGRVKSFAWGKEKIIKQHAESSGYSQVTLRKNNKRKHFLVHRLVAKEFLPNPKLYKEVNHKDVDKSNNFVDNLEWCSRRENIMHSIKMGRHCLENLKLGGRKAWR